MLRNQYLSHAYKSMRKREQKNKIQPQVYINVFCGRYVSIFFYMNIYFTCERSRLQLRIYLLLCQLQLKKKHKQKYCLNYSNIRFMCTNKNKQITDREKKTKCCFDTFTVYGLSFSASLVFLFQLIYRVYIRVNFPFVCKYYKKEYTIHRRRPGKFLLIREKVYFTSFTVIKQLISIYPTIAYDD